MTVRSILPTGGTRRNNVDGANSLPAHLNPSGDRRSKRRRHSGASPNLNGDLDRSGDSNRPGGSHRGNPAMPRLPNRASFHCAPSA
ncbi:hypothetical protein GCM10027562_27620 [Arthrobacter pigmenti]